MQAIRTDFKPQNTITTPLAGTPSYINSGIIKAVMKNGEKVSVAQIDYQEFDEENFQYVITPYWDIVDGLPSSVFQGIPGIDMDLRLKDYYRVNYIPTFISERTPSENREDLWELLESVGLDYYEHKPITVNLKEMRSVAIYGKKKFGKTNLLQLLIHGIRQKHPDYIIVLVDDGRKQLESLHFEDNPNSVYKNRLEDLAEFLESNGYAKVRPTKPGGSAFEEKITPPTVFVLQSKMLFQQAGKGFITAFAGLIAKAEERKWYFPLSRKRGKFIEN